MVVANAHDSILFFTDRGQGLPAQGHAVPELDRTARGHAGDELIGIEPGETVTAVLAAPNFEDATS